MIARQVFYAGRVQGVGFRFATKQLAAGFDVVGWVRNLPDGRVELQVMGEEEEVDAFLEELEENSSLAHHILEKENRQIPLLQGARGFSIER
ncbi:MAG: acylphosphatase [Verrucomicrobiales bacterium]